MGDHVVLIVKAWYTLTRRFAHKHLVFLRYLFQGFRDLFIYVSYETLFHVYLHGQEKRPARPEIVGDWYAYLR